MNSTLGVVLALLFLSCCLQIVSTQQPSPAFYEFLGYLSGIEKNKPINWTTTLYFLYTGQVSPRCFTDAYTVHNDTLLVKSYAGQILQTLKLNNWRKQGWIVMIFVLDSTGKMTPSGMFQGNWVAMGNYKECTVDANNAPDRPHNFQTMYCALAWGGIPQALAPDNLFYGQGVCVPNTCSDQDVGLLTSTGLLGVKPMPSWYPIGLTCQREETYASYSGAAIAAIVILSIILIIITISSLYEFIINVHRPETRKSVTVSKLGGVVMSFSVYANTKKVFSLKSPPGQLPALHGIRVISTLWIIFGHTNFFTNGNIEISNKVERDGARKQWWFFIENNMDMAVDTFLLLSGLLVTYLFMKQVTKTGGVFTWRDYGLHLLHRYWRLTPVYGLLIMIYACLVVYMGAGPFWASPTNWVMPTIRGCQKYWWANLLYINNYFHGEKECIGWGWYLGVDMQLYIIVPGVLLLLYKKPKGGVMLTCVLIAACWVLHGVLYHFLVNVPHGDYVHTTYMYTATRMAPYLMGVLLGYLLFRTNQRLPNIQHKKSVMLLGWVVGTVCGLAGVVTPTAVFQNTDPPYYIQSTAGWRAVERSLFATGVAWVIYASCVGYGGIISEFLSWSGWLPLSRLTYTAYLVHPIIMQVYYMSYKDSLLYSTPNWLFYFVSFSFMAFVCGFAASMMAEVPFLELEKFVLPKRRGREVKPEGGEVNSELNRHDVEGQQYQPLTQEPAPEPRIQHYGSVST